MFNTCIDIFMHTRPNTWNRIVASLARFGRRHDAGKYWSQHEACRSVQPSKCLTKPKALFGEASKSYSIFVACNLGQGPWEWILQCLCLYQHNKGRVVTPSLDSLPLSEQSLPSSASLPDSSSSSSELSHIFLTISFLTSSTKQI